MTTTDIDWTTYAHELADLLQGRGHIRSAQWHAAIAGVPRHAFVPRAYEQDNTGQWVPWDTAGAWDRVYAPKTLVTDLQDQGGYLRAVSSSTTPELMVRMLETLDIHDGHRVLEIGTGTGYNAGLLSHRLGDDRVFSVDIDPELVLLARQRLAAVGYRPTLAAVDGQDGFPEHAPYDRIIATCSVPEVPWAWAEQLTPGGSILVDLRPAISAGNLVHLHERDGVLEGRFVSRQASFMAMRHLDRQAVPVPLAGHGDGEQRSRMTDAPAQPWHEPVLWFFAQLVGLPRGVIPGAVLDPDTREPTAATMSAPDGSWASISLTGDRTVTEAGSTPLWASVERAYALWCDLDRPGWDRLGLTANPDEQVVWLDNAESEHRWTLPASG